MSIKKDNVNVTAVNYNSQNVNKVILDNKCVWCKPFTYTQGTLPTGVASFTCTRSSTDEPTALTGTIANGGTIYYYDKLYWEATASTGYRITAIKGSNSPVTVSGAITGTTASGLTSARISGTISQGTLPPEVASITCYRKAYNGSSFAEYTGSTIYYGDQFYWTATAATGYNSPSLTYNNSSKVYTWTGSQNGSIDSVSASGLSAGTRRSFTISFGTTANKSLYGSWSKSSQTAYYGDKITVSGNSVICYKWDNNSTARWTVTVASYSNDAQYTYSAVTIAESNIASVTAEAAFTAYNTRTLNSYTITWKYLSAYPDTWATETQTYDYGATPSKTVSNVTSGSARKVPTGWDNLAAVTGNRTITANYKTQVNATFSGTRCSAKINGATPSNGWTDINKTITWTANTNCAFSSDGSTTTTTDTISTQKTNYTASANYVNVTKLTGTNCSTNFTTGWKSINDTITWTAGPAYAFDTSNTTSKSVAVVPGENKYTANYVKQYTLTISATNASYGTYSVSRNSSPYQGASTGALSNGATIYYGDVLTGTSSAKAVSYDGWSVTSVAAPTFTTTGDATSGNLTITNKSSYQATLYYNTSNAAGGTSAGTVAANGSKTVTGLSFNTQYYISARVDRTRTKHTYATDGDQYLGTNGVTGNVTATFKFKDTTSTDTGTIYSSVVSAKTAAQSQYTITWKYLSAYPDTWTTATQTYNYGTTPSRSNPNTVTSGKARKAFVRWDNLGIVTGNRTITAVYVIQFAPTIKSNYCTANRSSDTWYDSGTVITWTANDNYSFGGSTVKDTITQTITSGDATYSATPGYIKCTISGTRCTALINSGSILKVGDNIKYVANPNYSYTEHATTASNPTYQTVTLGTTSYSRSCDYVYIKVSGTNCNANVADGYRKIGNSITWTANTNYAFDSSGKTTASQTIEENPKDYSKSATHGKYTVNTTNCKPSVHTGWYPVTSSKSTAFVAYDGWSFGGTAVKDTITASAAVPGSVEASPAYCNITVSGINCSWHIEGVSHNPDIDFSGLVQNGNTITYVAVNANYAFDSSGTSRKTVTINGPGTYSESAPYGQCTIRSTNCTANVSTGWYPCDSILTVTWTANTNYAFDSSGKTTDSVADYPPGDYNNAANYVNVTKLTGTNCTAYTDNTYATAFTTGWKPANTYIYWKADAAYAFDTADNTTSESVKVVPGENKYTASYVKRYDLYVAKLNHVASAKAWRTASPYKQAPISSSENPLINGVDTTQIARIYYGDSLSMEASANQYYHFSGGDNSYTFVSQTISTVTGNVSWSPTAVANNYPVEIAAGEGISNVYLSSDGSATSGSPSGTEFPFGSTVYAFAQLNRSILSAITVPSGWVRVDSSDSWIYRVNSKQLNPSWNRDFGTINAILASYAVTINKSGEGINSVFLSTNPNATSGSPSGTKFKSTTTVYAFAAVHQNYVYRVPSSWPKIGTSGTSTVYRVGQVNITTSPHNFGTITLLAAYTVTVSCDRTGGLSKAYLSTSSTATSGYSSLSVASGTTVYGFAVLDSYKSADQFTGWKLISGTANEPGAIYRVGSKKITAATTYYINLFDESDDSAVIFKRSGENAGSWTISNHEIQSASGSCKIYRYGISIYAKYDDYNGSEHEMLLGKFTCPAGYEVNFTLSDYAGNRISLDSIGSSVDLEGPGPFTVMAWVEEKDTSTT